MFVALAADIDVVAAFAADGVASALSATVVVTAAAGDSFAGLVLLLLRFCC